MVIPPFALFANPHFYEMWGTRRESIASMSGLTKSLRTALVTFVVAYVAFFFLCVLSYAYSNPPKEPVPALLVGIPVGLIAALIAFIFSIVRRNST